jgi:hypothetical protein
MHFIRGYEPADCHSAVGIEYGDDGRIEMECGQS